MKLATYNVKDLFDPGVCTSPGGSPMTAEMAAGKREALARRINLAKPDVLALQEIASEKELARLAERTGLPHVLLAGADERGIASAILSRFPFTRKESLRLAPLELPVFVEGDPLPFDGRLYAKREIAYAEVLAPFGALHVYSVHFKSNRGLPLRKQAGGDHPILAPSHRAEADFRSSVLRAVEALAVRRSVDAILARDSSAAVAVLGDFNDRPWTLTVRMLMAGNDDMAGALVPVMERLPEEERATIVHRGRKQQIDHVLMSHSLAARVSSIRVYNHDLLDHDVLCEPTVDSDHALIEVDLTDA